MSSRMESELVTQALLAAVWRRKPKNQVLIHSDQGSQFTGYEWSDFLTEHDLKVSMSRRGNCHDNAVSESFFQLLKRERIKKKFIQHVNMQEPTYLITSKCFITLDASMVKRVICLHWLMKS